MPVAPPFVVSATEHSVPAGKTPGTVRVCPPTMVEVAVEQRLGTRVDARDVEGERPVAVVGRGVAVDRLGDGQRPGGVVVAHHGGVVVTDGHDGLRSGGLGGAVDGDPDVVG